MPEVANMDRDPTDDKEMPLGSMGWCGGDKPMDPCRDTITPDLRIKGAAMILEQSRIYGTNHPSEMTANIIPNPTRTFTPEMWAELGYDETEKTIPIKQPYKFPVPRRIDAIDTYMKTVGMEPTDEPRQTERLDHRRADVSGLTE